ncbi:response regulator, partial [Arthrospira platensis SPKY1]|nr:response regulator [Arthrospira platensis SPKY1]
MLTGSGDQDSAVAALKAGADDYLVKRDDYLEHLAERIEAACIRRRGATDSEGRGLRVLYVEHNGFDADLLRRHLSEHAPHIQLSIVATAAEALTLLNPGSGQGMVFDVVLADYRLPGMDGLELARTLRRDHGLDLPVVLITGQGSEELAAKALNLGVDDYLAKHEGYFHEVAAVLEKVQRQAELKREREVLRSTSDRLGRMIEASPSILYSLTLCEGEA